MAGAVLSFRSWEPEQTAPRSIASLLERVNKERGHFRDIVENSLQEELAAEGGLELSESEEDDEEADDGAEEGQGRLKPATREELYRAKFDMLQRVSFAHNEVMMALDFVSLLESKDAPAGRQTMSHFLKENVQTGTLGTDIWQRMPKEVARETQDASLARNVRMSSLQKSAHDLLGAAKRLEDNVRKETRYWDQILSIADEGWNVCRLPGQQHRLGVRFGCSESAPEFVRRGIAALNAGEDGTITLERGIGVNPKSLRVTVHRDGRVTGRSRTTSTTSGDEMSLEGRIRHARNSLFDEELYHEMECEGRSMLSMGVRIHGSTIHIPSGSQGSECTYHFDLISPEDEDVSAISPTTGDDHVAQALSYVVRLLLCQAHRARVKRRTQIPPPLSERREETSVMPILRPIMSLMLHRSSLDVLNSYLDHISKLLDVAGIALSVSPARLQPPHSEHIKKVDDLTSALSSQWSDEAQIAISPPERGNPVAIRFTVETSQTQRSGSIFTASISDQKKLYFTTPHQLVSDLDWILSSLLLESLATVIGPGWELHKAQGRLLKDRRQSDDAANELWTQFRGKDGALVLGSAKGTARWMVEDNVEERSYWQAWRDLV